MWPILSSGAPILLLCMARPELLERSRRAGGKWNATTVLLEPLDADETERALRSWACRQRAARADRCSRRGKPAVPGRDARPGPRQQLSERRRSTDDSGAAGCPTRPTRPRRTAVLEHGSVEGDSSIVVRCQRWPMETQVTRGWRARSARADPRPDRPQFVGDDAYRFRHLLIRDAAYDALPKSARADLHRRFAAWLEEHGHDLVELDEILGYHLEQAARYLAELGRPDPDLAAAASRLAAAGRRARWRYDRRAAQSLLQRAVRPHGTTRRSSGRRSRENLEPALRRRLLNDAVDVPRKATTQRRGSCGRCGGRCGGLGSEDVETSRSGVRSMRCRCSKLPEITRGSPRSGSRSRRRIYNARARFEQMEHAAEQASPARRARGSAASDPSGRSPCALLGAASRPGGSAHARHARHRPLSRASSGALLLAMNDQIEEARLLARTPKTTSANWSDEFPLTW